MTLPTCPAYIAQPECDLAVTLGTERGTRTLDLGIMRADFGR
jgi:hypothetical protein